MDGLLTVTDKDMKTLEQEISEMAAEVKQLKPETPTVDRMMARFEHQWQTTADICIRRAVELEEEAAHLREQASYLLNALQLTQAMKDTVAYEINARNAAARVALVNPSE